MFLYIIILLIEAAIANEQTVALTIAGFLLSWLMAGLKRLSNNNLKGPLAHAIVLIFSGVIALIAHWYTGGIHSVADVFKSLAVVATTAVATYHFIVDQTGVENRSS